MVAAVAGQRSAAGSGWKLWLGLLLLVALALRLAGLEAQSLDNDELSMWTRSLRPIEGALSDSHPPLFHLLEYLVMATLGDAPWALRLPSLLAGVAAVAALFALAARLYGKPTGLLAAALLAVLVRPIYHSQRARMYSLLLLAAVLLTHATLAMLQAVRERRPPSWPALSGFVLAALLAAYTHYFGLLLLFLLGVLLLGQVVRLRFFPGRLALGFGLVLVGYLPWLPGMISQMSKQTEFSAARTAVGWDFYPTTFAWLFHTSQAWLLALVAALIAAALLRACLVASARNDLWLVAWLVGPCLVMQLKGWLDGNALLQPRNLLISLPAAYLLLARGILAPQRKRWLGALLAALVLGGFVADLFYGHDYYTRPHGVQFREAAGLVAEQAPDPERAMVVACAFNGAYFDYYFERADCAQRVALVLWRVEDLPALRKALRGFAGEELWLLRAHRPIEAGLLESLRVELRAREHTALRGADVWRFERVR